MGCLARRDEAARPRKGMSVAQKTSEAVGVVERRRGMDIRWLRRER